MDKQYRSVNLPVSLSYIKVGIPIMLKTKKLLSIVLLSLVAASGIFAAEPVKEVKDGSAKMHLLHNWGFAWARVTRLIINKNRSNFVWQDYLIGAYFDINTINMKNKLHLSIAMLPRFLHIILTISSLIRLLRFLNRFLFMHLILMPVRSGPFLSGKLHGLI